MEESRHPLCEMTNYMLNGQSLEFPGVSTNYNNQNFNDVIEIGPTNQEIPSKTPSQHETLYSAQLKRTYYSQEIDYFALKELLESWNVGELFDYFQREYNIF